MDIRVMTYNICSGHHYVNHVNHVLEWNNPDVKYVGEVIEPKLWRKCSDMNITFSQRHIE